MANFILCLCIFRIALPILITTCIVFRPSLLSAIYLLLLLYLPIVPVPTTSTMAGHTGNYLRVLIAISVLTTVSQLAFQIVLFAMPPYANFLQNCEMLEKILRHCGFVRLDNISFTGAMTWLTPEIVMLISSIIVYVVCSKLTAIEILDGNEQGSVQPLRPKKRKFGLVTAIGLYLTLAALSIAAILRPSILGGLYFLIFLCASTWWACNKELRRGFAILCRCTMVVVFIHIAILYGYQFQWPQEFLGSNSTYARYFGLTNLMYVECRDPREFVWSDLEWASFVNPLALVFLYYILTIESNLLLMPQVETEPTPASETTPLIRGVSPSRKYGSGSKKSNVFQDSTGSVTVSGEGLGDIPMEELGPEVEDQPTMFENVMFALESLIQVIIRTSYIGTNIIMMAWSITYHSWLTFVLLLWANLLWMVPNQRRSMLRSSPFLVFYAWFLLLSAYIYSMNLTEEELPSKVQDFNLAQIGFQKILVLPCNPLFVKCLYTTMFFITLRQFMKERQEKKQSSALADMVAPLQVTVGTATGVTKEEEKGSKILQVIGQHVKSFLTKFWIWVVAITLFVVAITGQRMTGFRIIYMALFLFFILIFQLSFRMWRKVMFGFWLTVIVYSMIILILTYTYQFDNFRDYWRDYLKVPEEQQLDIGLERYETKQLFVRLVTPTFFVIITVIQLHYFHKDFLKISDPANTSILEVRSEGSSAQGGALEPTSEKSETDTTTVKFDLTDNENFSSVTLLKKLQSRFKSAVNLIFLFLEIHMPKLVLLIAMLVCIYDRCAVYLVIVVLIVLAFMLGRPVQLFAIFTISILVSIMLLARMVYQIKYVNHERWNVTCEDTNSTCNSAEWFGFYKLHYNTTLTDLNTSVPNLVKWNITFILCVTFWSVVQIRQQNYRQSKGKPQKRPYFMFPKIRRADADKDLVNFFKYLANYGYYKFGVEICLMATVGVIGIRNDIYAVFYAIWLCILFSLKRSTLAKVWNVYLAFIAVLLPIQYIMVIGLPPALCVQFPWSRSDTLRRLQEWAFLMDSQSLFAPPAKKLFCDFILLLFVARQSLVFRIEKRHVEQEYPGGSNESIIHFAEDKNFINPVPDFITYCRSYLDVIKRAFLLSFMWITLAIVFLAGTNRVNIFSIGYLLGSFIFLWQGADFYLKPISNIIKSWNYFLGYNVCVIVIKAFLQLVGCVFLKEMTDEACWLVQLLAVGCVKKFDDIAKLAQLEDITQCPVPREYIGLAWDGACFGFLLVQRRIFSSFNFFHMINETKATTILASRGAELIEKLRQRCVQDRQEDEKRILEKIKAKMDRIKANQQKINGPGFKDTTNHHAAVRSGDYYMFDELDDDELDLIKDKIRPAEDDEEYEEYKTKRQKTISEFVSMAIKTDIQTTVRGPQYEQRRHSSVPLSRQRSYMSARSQLSAPLSAPPTVEEYIPREHLVSFVDDVKKREDPQKHPQPSTSKDEEISELSEPVPETNCQMILTYILFIWAFIQSCLVSMTNMLNVYSRDYRYVLRVLNKEKKMLKEKTDYNVGIRAGASQVWEPSGSYHTLLKESVRQGSPSPELLEYEGAEMSSVDQPTYIRLILAMWYIVLSHSDILCYFMIFLNQIKSATFLSLPLPLMVFFWGTLNSPRPSKTFWVTIIAYTEVIVLIKCLFQFEILPWNDVTGVTDYPFTAQRIIGIERNKYYAVWDLILLLIVFFHRFLLKCLGLWKTSYSSLIVLPDGDYKVVGGELQLIHLHPSKQKGKQKFNSRRPLIVHPTRKYVPPSDLVDLSTPSLTRFRKKKKQSNNLAAYLKTIRSKKLVSQAISSEAGMAASKTSPGSRKGDLQKLVELPEDNDDDNRSRKSDKSEKSLQCADDENQVKLVTDVMDPSENFAAALQMAISKYAEAIRTFFRQLLDPTTRVADDVYSYMFLCDFFNFFVILIGYSSFGLQQGDGGVSSYLEDDRVPVLFLLMLILQFLLIIVDRAIYLRKYILGKIIFQFLQILILHVWLFILYPLITERSFSNVLAPQMYYMVKCFYLLLSAYQIRSGYPTRILGNFLCKGYNYPNMILFKGFMAIPFLFELRVVMDWMWTDTSMAVFDWVKMEDIFAHIYQLKCSRYVENEYPQPRGEKKSPTTKYLMGTAILALIVAIIWFPLVFFSLGNAVGKPNIPVDVTVDMRIGPYQPIYQMSAQSNAIYSFNDKDLSALLRVYSKNKVGTTFISNYEAADIAAVKLNSDSASVWNISPPDKRRMVEEINSTSPVTVRIQYQISHQSNTKENTGIIREDVVIVIPYLLNGKINPVRQSLLEMLTSNATTPPIPMHYLMPKFVKVTNRGTAKAITQLMDSDLDFHDSDATKSLRNVTIKLFHSNYSIDEPSKIWWEVMEECEDYNYMKYLAKIPYADCNFLMIYTFNDRIFPSTLSIITAGGIIGCFTVYFLVIFKLVRTNFTEKRIAICWLDDMPNVDRIYQLLLNIYLVRALRQYDLEEMLFAQLVFIMRSTELAIKMTRKLGTKYNPEIVYEIEAKKK